VVSGGDLGTSDVTVRNGALLSLQTDQAIANSATLELTAGSPNGKVFIGSGLSEDVAELLLGAATYTTGTFTSGTHPDWFSGEGSVTVGASQGGSVFKLR